MSNFLRHLRDRFAQTVRSGLRFGITAITPRLLAVAEKRNADKIIGGKDDPYLLRWYVIPRNRWFNVYLHRFVRSDDDRALHDHPWINCSVVLDGSYKEVTPNGTTVRVAGDLIFRKPSTLHRIELFRTITSFPLPFKDGEFPVWTLFLTGPVVRDWGFACPQGWRHWKDFSD